MGWRRRRKKKSWWNKRTVGVAQKIFTKQIMNGAIFLLTPAANHAWYRPFFYWLHETAACFYFGVDLGKGLDHYSLSRLTDGTAHSSSDLLYFTLLLRFTWTNFSMSNSISHILPFAQKFYRSNFRSLFSLDKNIVSSTSILQKYSKTNPNSVLAAKTIQSRKNILSPFSFRHRKIPFFC